MTMTREQRAYALFREASGRAPGERDAYLDEACGADETLRAEVAAMQSAAGSAPLVTLQK